MKDRLPRLALLLAVLGVLLLLPVFCRGAIQKGSDDVTARVEAQRKRLPCSFTLANTHSMEPKYLGGEEIWVESISYDELTIGSEVLLWPAGMKAPVFHVLVGRFGGLWITRGINKLTNSRTDPWYCTPTNLIGIVRHK